MLRLNQSLGLQDRDGLPGGVPRSTVRLR